MKTDCKYYYECGNADNCKRCKGYESVKVVYCVGAKWFDKVNGNTYNNVKVVDGLEVVYLGYEYGYGNYYYHRAHEYFTNKYGKDNYKLIDLGCAYYKKAELKNDSF